MDDNSPILIGNNLLNQVIEEDIVKSKRKIGKRISFNFLKLKEKYQRELQWLHQQNNLFKAAEEGDFEKFRSGADLEAKVSNLWTSLHYACKGQNLEIVKFIIQNGVDILVYEENGQTPLHIAAAHGRTHIVEYLIKEKKMKVDKLDMKKKSIFVRSLRKSEEVK
jgi:ankyrin repeat protein